MGTFHYFYDENLGGMSLKYSDNLSPWIETSHMPAAECQLVATLTKNTLTKLRTEEDFSILGKVQESCHRTEDKWACPAT